MPPTRNRRSEVSSARSGSYVSHTNTPKIPCTWEGCSSTPFTRVSDVARHVRDVHLRLKSYTCKYCGRGFAQKCARDTHVNTHTGDRPFPCNSPGCAMTFADRSVRCRHMKEQHTPCTESFKCTFCAKVFKRKGVLQQHIFKVHESTPSDVTEVDTPTTVVATTPLSPTQTPPYFPEMSLLDMDQLLSAISEQNPSLYHSTVPGTSTLSCPPTSPPCPEQLFLAPDPAISPLSTLQHPLEPSSRCEKGLHYDAQATVNLSDLELCKQPVTSLEVPLVSYLKSSPKLPSMTHSFNSLLGTSWTVAMRPVDPSEMVAMDDVFYPYYIPNSVPLPSGIDDVTLEDFMRAPLIGSLYSGNETCAF
ncbi:uncharacterized protein EI90DRAFT_3292129 [Cantharellus anzutake]|uniref:uncharacterized protein n=1 Tax=Cantharellus anzutake TaxID=1750568 RepID=UPI00190608FE|nr:uncharacterized protein EI90DRAFT_3292129 [Cantharellus anzutake]KAF8324440.1 hypothetical protein EI90DRAFT_3292129 [Cantharellus anzutake]